MSPAAVLLLVLAALAAAADGRTIDARNYYDVTAAAAVVQPADMDIVLTEHGPADPDLQLRLQDIANVQEVDQDTFNQPDKVKTRCIGPATLMAMCF